MQLVPFQTNGGTHCCWVTPGSELADGTGAVVVAVGGGAAVVVAVAVGVTVLVVAGAAPDPTDP